MVLLRCCRDEVDAKPILFLRLVVVFGRAFACIFETRLIDSREIDLLSLAGGLWTHQYYCFLHCRLATPRHGRVFVLSDMERSARVRGHACSAYVRLRTLTEVGTLHIKIVLVPKPKLLVLV